MKLKIAVDNLKERIALMLNLVPAPLIETQISFTAARAIMAAAELGIFEALGKGSKTFQHIAGDVRTHAAATKQLLDCLTAIGYLKWSNDRYSLKPRYYKWLLKEYQTNLIGKLRFQISEWNWMAKLEDYVRTGKPLEIHSVMDNLEWVNYQDAMRDLAVSTAKELAGKITLTAQTPTMLDIGGSHGMYSIELCRKYPTLTSTILDLPGAIGRASAIAASHGLTDRVKYQSGNALTDDLGEEQYDLVLINNVVHHFTFDDNVKLAGKVARALKPGGMYAVGEVIRGDKPGDGGAAASCVGLYFSLTSESGAWSVEEINAWQRQAGLKTQRPISLMTLPGWKMLMAIK